MNPIFRETLIAIAVSGLIGCVLTAPLLVALIRMTRIQRAYGRTSGESFTELALRPPGESLRLKIEQLSEVHYRYLIMRGMVALSSAILVFAVHPNYRFWVLGACVTWVIIDCIFSVPKIVRNAEKLFGHRLGFSGERVVGEELNQLRSSGYQVFHDVPFEKYNIDHIVAGPGGVFAIETKTRRKPRVTGDVVTHSVRFDGETLHWPRGKESAPIDQALYNARALSHWLSSTTGEPVRAQGIVTLPGWCVDDNTEHTVWVLNPTRIKPVVESCEGLALSPSHLDRIAEQLTERCRLKRS